MAKIDELIKIIRPILPSTTNNLQHLKRSRNIVGNGVGKYNDPLWSIGKTDKRPRNIKVLSQAEIDELNRANQERYQGLLHNEEDINRVKMSVDPKDNPHLKEREEAYRAFMDNYGEYEGLDPEEVKKNFIRMYPDYAE